MRPATSSRLISESIAISGLCALALVVLTLLANEIIPLAFLGIPLVLAFSVLIITRISLGKCQRQQYWILFIGSFLSYYFGQFAAYTFAYPIVFSILSVPWFIGISLQTVLIPTLTWLGVVSAFIVAFRRRVPPLFLPLLLLSVFLPSLAMTALVASTPITDPPSRLIAMLILTFTSTFFPLITLSLLLRTYAPYLLQLPPTEIPPAPNDESPA